MLELLACGARLSKVLGALAIGVTQLQPGVHCAVLLIEPQPNGVSPCLRVGAATGLPDFFGRPGWRTRGRKLRGLGHCGVHR